MLGENVGVNRADGSFIAAQNINSKFDLPEYVKWRTRSRRELQGCRRRHFAAGFQPEVIAAVVLPAIREETRMQLWCCPASSGLGTRITSWDVSQKSRKGELPFPAAGHSFQRLA